LNLIIPILGPYFHSAHSLRRARFSYLLDSGTKEGQSAFACSPEGLYLYGTRGERCAAQTALRDLSREVRQTGLDIRAASARKSRSAFLPKSFRCMARSRRAASEPRTAPPDGGGQRSDLWDVGGRRRRKVQIGIPRKFAQLLRAGRKQTFDKQPDKYALATVE
jgi:hypothetical protein